MANLMNPADIASAYQGGLQFGQQLRERKRIEDERTQLRNLAPQIMQGDPAAFSQAAAINPEAATTYQSAGDSQYRRVTNVAKMMRDAINTGNPTAKQRAFQTIRPFLSQMAGGRPVPEQWDDSLLPGFEQFESRISMAQGPQGQQRNLAVTPGTAIVNPDTGQVIYERPFAPSKPIWDSARGMFINPPGTEAQAAGPSKMDMEADANTANEMIAAGIPPENVDRWLQARGERAQRMVQPTGPQAIPVPGVAPKPEISALDQERLNIDRERLRLQQQEQERKANAPSAAAQKTTAAQATKLPQVNNVERGLDRIEAAMKALDGGVVNTGPLDQYVVRNLPSGQELEAAIGGIQNSLLALTRVPGVGSQSDLEAKIAALQYPSLDKDPEVNRRTLENLRSFVNDLKQQIQAAPAQSTAPTTQRAVNPTTGEVLVLRNGQWVPE